MQIEGFFYRTDEAERESERMKYQKIRGTTDILPDESSHWQILERVIHELFERYHFAEVRTPIFEQYELFARGVGETSDIVSKEMYDFYDKGERHIALRPEGTAGVVRAYVENKLYGPEFHKPQKFYYIGPMFRFERPQSGRMRQFHQAGVEVFGSYNPAVDAETIMMAYELFKSLGIEDLELVINSLGSNESRIKYREALIEYFEPYIDQLSEDSKERIYKNPLRILDSKDRGDQKLVERAPSILDFLDDDSKAHFDEVKRLLEDAEIPYVVDENLVRGLDYYNDTIFELVVKTDTLGTGSTICAGGRYDGLVEQMGGPETGCFGFAIGLERVLILLEENGYHFPEGAPLDAFVVTIGSNVNREATSLAQSLRQRGWRVEREFNFRKPKAQFRTGDRLNANWIFTLGEYELENGQVNMKSLDTGQEIAVDIADIYNLEIDLVEKFHELQEEDND